MRSNLPSSEGDERCLRFHFYLKRLLCVFCTKGNCYCHTFHILLSKFTSRNKMHRHSNSSHFQPYLATVSSYTSLYSEVSKTVIARILTTKKNLLDGCNFNLMLKVWCLASTSSQLPQALRVAYTLQTPTGIASPDQKVLFSC